MSCYKVLLANLKSYSKDGLNQGYTIFSIDKISLYFFKTIINTVQNSTYINVYEKTNKKLKSLLAVIPDSNSSGIEYVFTGDGTPAFPSNTDENGFWLYHKGTKQGWVSIICVIGN